MEEVQDTILTEDEIFRRLATKAGFFGKVFAAQTASRRDQNRIDGLRRLAHRLAKPKEEIKVETEVTEAVPNGG